MKNKIEFDDSLQLSEKQYLSSDFLKFGIIEVYYQDKGFKEASLTAKEWIIREIAISKSELRNNKNKILNKKKDEATLRELNKLHKYFDKHITKLDILGLHTLADNESNKILDTHFNQIKELIANKRDEQKQHLKDVKNKNISIKRICLENIKIILRLENVRSYADSAKHLMSINSLAIYKNHKQTEYAINSYSQHDVEFYIKKLPKSKATKK